MGKCRILIVLAATAACLADVRPSVADESVEASRQIELNTDEWLRPSQRQAASENDAAGDDAAPDAAAAPKVGLAGDPRTIRVEVAQAFDAGVITSALALDLVYQAAARPSGDLVTLIDALRDRVVAGYRHAGYLDAKVEASYDGAADCLVVKVVEGPQRLAGAIRVVGAQAIDAEELAARAGRPTPSRHWVYDRLVDATEMQAHRSRTRSLNTVDEDAEDSPWQAGAPCPGDAETLAKLTNIVELHLADMGFPFAVFRLRVDPTSDGEADLVIEIQSEGPPEKAGKITFAGLTRHTEQQLLDFLQIREGAPLDAKELERIYQALRQSCRFWEYGVWVRYSGGADERYGGGGTTELWISVVEYDRVPMLGEPLSEADQCLVRTAQWLEEFWNGDDDEEFVFEGDVPNGDAWLTSLGSMCVVLSRQNGCLATFAGTIDGVDVDSAAIMSREGLSFFDWHSGMKLTATSVQTPTFALKLAGGAVEEGEYRCSLVLGAGMTNDPPIGDKTTGDSPTPHVWEGCVEPVAMVHSAHRQGTTASLNNGVLTLISDDSRCEIDAASGRILAFEYDNGPVRWTLRLTHGEYERASAALNRRSADLAEMFDSDDPLTSMANFAIASALAQQRVQTSPLMRLACERAAQFLQSRDTDPLVQQLGANLWPARSAGDAGTAKFVIPRTRIAYDGPDYFDSLVHVGPAFADVMFPRGSWLWTWTREFTFLAADNWQEGPLVGNFTDRGYYLESNRVFHEASHFGRWAMIAYAPGGLRDGAAATLARFSLKWPEADFAAELHALLHGDHGLVRLTRVAVVLCDELDEPSRQTLLNCLDEPWRDIVAQLFVRRLDHPDEAPEDALEGVILDAWTTGGAAAIDARLKTMAGLDESPTELSAQRTDAAATK